MASIKDILAQIGLSTASAVVQQMLLELFENIQKNNDKDPQLYIDLIQDGHAWLTRLEQLAAKTKTKIDDTVIRMILEPVRAAAAADDIEL